MLTTSCTPKPGDWGGLYGSGLMTLTGATIGYAMIGVQSQATGSASRSGKLLTATGVTIHDCLQGFYTGDVSLTDTTVTDITRNPSNSFPAQAVTAQGSVHIRGLTMSRVAGTGIWATPAEPRDGVPPSTFDVVGVTVDHAGLGVQTSGWGGPGPAEICRARR